MLKNTKEKDINKAVMICGILFLIIVRVLFAGTQYVTITPPLAPIDDDFMFKAAQSITNGQWLGDYNYLTLSKHAFFAVWLSFLHLIKMPYLVGNALLWAGASLVTLVAFYPVIKQNFAKLFLFAGILYNPAMWAQFTTRIYRDSIFPSLCLILFSSIAAIGLRHKQDIKKWWIYIVLCGISLGAVYLTREDGIWVLPFAIVAFIIIAVRLAVEKQSKIFTKIIAMAIPFIICITMVGGYCGLNYKHYGRFIVSDFTSSEFEKAYGALISIEHENWQPIVAVPKDVREKLYKQVPSFAKIEKALEEPILKNGYYNKALDDFQSGGFYWALRTALQNLGEYDTPQKAKAYYENLYKEIDNAVKEGRLPAEKLKSGVTSPIKTEYILPVMAEGINGFMQTVLFNQCSPLATKAVGYPWEIAEVESYIHQKGGTVLKENSDEIYLPFLPSVTHKIMRIINVIYKIGIPLMLIISVFWQIKQMLADIYEKKFTQKTMLNFILLGFLAMALLRCFMIAFVEVSSFNIGTYIMYLSTVHPLVIVYSFVGFCKTFEG